MPPWNSSGFNLLSFALVARSLTSAEMTLSPLPAASNTIGVINPAGVATATEMSIWSFGTLVVPSQDEFARGTSRKARATALITTSFTETLTPNSFMRCFRNLATPAKSASIDENACGTNARDSVKRLAMTLRIVVAGTSSKGALVVGIVAGSKGVRGRGWKGSPCSMVAGAGAATAVVVDAEAPSAGKAVPAASASKTSPFVMRPPLPDPTNPLTSMF